MPDAHFHRNIVVIGASAGGVPALQQLVAGLPVNFPAAVFIVLHVWSGSVSLLPRILARTSKLPVIEARHEQRFAPGNVYVAPADLHLFVERDHLSVLRGPKENRTRPAINPLFRSAAMAHGNRVIGIILTGMLDDGAAGLWAIKQCGGLAIAQADAEFSEMPESARQNVQLDHFVPLAEIPPLLDRLTREPLQPAVRATPAVVQHNDDVAKMSSDSNMHIDQVGRRSVFTCPECNGALWELEEGSLQYRCHVGHAFSAASLSAAHDSVIEQSLWSALRALKESAALDDRLATQSAEHDLPDAARIHRANAHDKLAQADHLQQFLSTLRPPSPETEIGKPRAVGEE